MTKLTKQLCQVNARLDRIEEEMKEVKSALSSRNTSVTAQLDGIQHKYPLFSTAAEYQDTENYPKDIVSFPFLKFFQAYCSLPIFIYQKRIRLSYSAVIKTCLLEREKTRRIKVRSKS